MKQGTQVGNPASAPANTSKQLSLRAVPRVRIRVFIAAVGATALRVVRQPVLVAVDSHQILKGCGYTSLLVSLQFWKTEDYVRIDSDRETRYSCLPDE